jgi:hypothetical protein
MMEISSAMIKEEERHILNLLPVLLKVDRSFRHEISVTLSEIFPTRDEFKQIIEEIRQNREETNRRFEAMDRRFEAMDRRFEALQKDMRDGFALQGKAIQDLQVAVGNLEATVHTLGVTIGALGARWGKEAEETLRQTLKKFLLERMEVKEVKEWRGYDKEGIVFDHPGEIQIDLLLKNKKHYLVELKSSAGCGDVYLLLRKAKFYEQETGVKPELIFVAVQMREEGKKLCQELKVRLISYGEK